MRLVCVCVCGQTRARAHAFQRVLAASTSPRVAARSCAAIAAVQPSIWFCSDGARALRRAVRPRYRQHGHASAHIDIHQSADLPADPEREVVQVARRCAAHGIAGGHDRCGTAAAARVASF